LKCRSLILPTVFIVLCLPTAGIMQTGPQPTGAVSGVVTDAATATPLPDVLVYLASFNPGRVQKRQLTDAKGRFAFTDLPPSPTYTIATSKAGYLDGGYLQNGGPGGALTNLTVREDEWVQNVNIAMQRPGAITGVVTDEQGEPVVGVLVRVIQRLRVQGRDVLASGVIALTDDRGAYRIGGLLPGRYLVLVPSVQMSMPASMPMGPSRAPVSVSTIEMDDANRLVLSRYPPPPPPRAGRPMAYPPAFYPGTGAVAQATTIDLKYGEERAGIDIRLEPVLTTRVSGRLQGLAEGTGSVRLRLMPSGLESLGLGAEVASVLATPDGRFTFLNVPAGTYTLDGQQTTTEFTSSPGGLLSNNAPLIPMPPGLGGSRLAMNADGAPPGTQIMSTYGNANAASYFGRATVTTTGQEISDVVVTMKTGAFMSGRVIFEPDPNQPPPTMPLRASVRLDPANGDPRLGIPGSNSAPDSPANEFEISGLLPGEYWLRGPSSGWLVKSIQWKGKDYAVTPFDTAATQDLTGVVVTLTNAVPTLTGTVRDRDGQPAIGAAVMIFPVERALWTNFGLMPARIKSTMTGPSGIFTLTTLPAGEYCVVAMSTRPRAWMDSDFFAAAEPLSTRVKLSWGGTSSADVKLSTPGVISR
jgi:hypothetical protein